MSALYFERKFHQTICSKQIFKKLKHICAWNSFRQPPRTSAKNSGTFVPGNFTVGAKSILHALREPALLWVTLEAFQKNSGTFVPATFLGGAQNPFPSPYGKRTALSYIVLCRRLFENSGTFVPRLFLVRTSNAFPTLYGKGCMPLYIAL